MIKEVKRNGIAVEEVKNKVGTIYTDEWNGKRVRFHDHRKEKQKILHRNKLQEKILENSWSIDQIDTPSDSYEVVYEYTTNHLCSDCEQDAMYDTEQDEFYCPRCHE
jgi:hypothetical protein